MKTQEILELIERNGGGQIDAANMHAAVLFLLEDARQRAEQAEAKASAEQGDAQ